MISINKNHFLIITIILLLTSVVGCTSTQGNAGSMSTFQTPVLEAEWILDGEPLQHEGELWYPQDSVDLLLDSEVYLVGEYQGVQFFVEKVDVRPYNRLYTKFDKNKFRLYERKVSDD